jgi:rhamnosyl/mannosyltransferase
MEHVDADLVLIGRGPLEGQLREIAVARGLDYRTSFIPQQDEAELAAWYHAADVFALPSVARSEAFGLVQIEAHAAGTPVISTNLTTSVPYANLDGVTGLVVPVGSVQALADALRRLLGDDALRARLGEQARKRALSQFTIPRMVDNVQAVYAEAIELHAARGGRT